MPLYLSAPGLTKRQCRVLCAVAYLTAIRGFPPSFREIMAEVGLSNMNEVTCFVKRIRKAGYITWDNEGTHARTLRLTRPLQWIETKETP